MSYCVHCGVELDPTAEFCPLCHTPVQNPVQPVDRESPKPFPTERQEVPLAAKWELAVLISAMLASAAVCCGSPVIQLLADVLAVSAYVGAIAWNVGGLSGWYVHIALPIILWLGAELLAVMLPLRRGRSILSTTTILIGAIGVFPLGVELVCDLYFRGVWQPTWSLVVLTIGVALMIPLIIVRRVPSLREEVRRRLHSGKARSFHSRCRTPD